MPVNLYFEKYPRSVQRTLWCIYVQGNIEKHIPDCAGLLACRHGFSSLVPSGWGNRNSRTENDGPNHPEQIWTESRPTGPFTIWPMHPRKDSITRSDGWSDRPTASGIGSIWSWKSTSFPKYPAWKRYSLCQIDIFKNDMVRIGLTIFPSSPACGR